jgi:hypothetical protein
MHFGQKILLTLGIALLTTTALAQTVLPDVHVTAPRWEERHGGYLISSNFQVDSHMSAVIFPAEPFQKDDILDFRTVRMNDDEYFVLQECTSADCTQGRVLRVWTRTGALDTAHDPYRVWIPHEGKFFMWMQRFPMAGGGSFGGYNPTSPPLVLNPIGTPEQFHLCDVKAAQERGPVKVLSTEHSGTQLALHFETGSTVFIQRMHALE